MTRSSPKRALVCDGQQARRNGEKGSRPSAVPRAPCPPPLAFHTSHCSASCLLGSLRRAGDLGYKPKDESALTRRLKYQASQTFSTRDGPKLKPKAKPPPIRSKKMDFSHVKSKISHTHEKPHKPGGGGVVIPMSVTHKRDPKKFVVPEPPKPRKLSPKSQRPWQRSKSYAAGKKSKRDQLQNLAIKFHDRPDDATTVKLVLQTPGNMLQELPDVYAEKFDASLVRDLAGSIRQSALRAPLLSLFGSVVEHESALITEAMNSGDLELVAEMLLVVPLAEKQLLLGAYEDSQHRPLGDALRDRTEGHSALLFDSILRWSSSDVVDDEAVQAGVAAIQHLKLSPEADWGPGGDGPFVMLLRTLNPAELAALAAVYKDNTGRGLVADLDGVMSVETNLLLDIIVKSISDPAAFLAGKLRQALVRDFAWTVE